MHRVLTGAAIAVLLVFGGLSILLLGRGRYETIPVHFITQQQVGLVNRGPASSRVALVIGIDHYKNLGKENQLERAKSDAKAMAAKLKSLGYDTILDTDATREKIYADLDRTVSKIKPGGAAFFYFAGHGISIKAANYLDGANYLVPSDAPSPNKHALSTFEYASVPLLSIIEQFRRSGARTSVIVLDSCRDSPYQGQNRSVTEPAAKDEANVTADRSQGDFYVLYSASPGEVALDRLESADGDQNSVFTRVLLKNLSDSVRLQDLTRSIQSGVSQLSNGAQRPISYSSMDDRLTITGGLTSEDSAAAVYVDARATSAAEKNPIARSVQKSVDMARTAEADAREWAQSASAAESKAKEIARQADEARSRSQQGLPGYGKKVLDNGATYEGQMANGEPNGVGVAIKASVFAYRGEWSAAQRAGYGILENTKSHFTYAGEWHDDKWEGAGVCRYPDGKVYNGEWHYGQPDGFGVLTGSKSDPFLELVGQFNQREANAEASYSVVYERAGRVVYGLTKHGKLEGPAAKLDREGHVIEQGYYEDDVRKAGM